MGATGSSASKLCAIIVIQQLIPPITMSAAIQIPKIKILLRPAIVIDGSIVGNILLCQICLLKIYDASALSLNKKQSSTYNKYACGCFLYAPSICIAYFKRLTERGIYFVEQCTRKYSVQQAIFKRLTEKSFLQVPALENRSRSKNIYKRDKKKIDSPKNHPYNFSL